MKKAFLFLIAIILLAGSVAFTVRASGGDTVSADVYSKYFLDVEAGEYVHAQYYNSAETLQALSCEGTGDPGFVSCQFPKEYAGQEVAVELTKNNVMYVSVVNVPAK
jgi:hypothetical protein